MALECDHHWRLDGPTRFVLIVVRVTTFPAAPIATALTAPLRCKLMLQAQDVRAVFQRAQDKGHGAARAAWFPADAPSLKTSKLSNEEEEEKYHPQPHLPRPQLRLHRVQREDNDDGERTAAVDHAEVPGVDRARLGL